MGTNETLRVGLTQDTPLSPVLFLLCIKDLQFFCPKPQEEEVKMNEIGEAEVSMTAYDVANHTRTWHHLQMWLDPCARWKIRSK